MSVNVDGTRCGWFTPHRWSKWADTSEFASVPLFGNCAPDIISGKFIVQQRRCEKCGKLESRRVNV